MRCGYTVAGGGTLPANHLPEVTSAGTTLWPWILLAATPAATWGALRIRRNLRRKEDEAAAPVPLPAPPDDRRPEA